MGPHYGRWIKVGPLWLFIKTMMTKSTLNYIDIPHHKEFPEKILFLYANKCARVMFARLFV